MEGVKLLKQIRNWILIIAGAALVYFYIGKALDWNFKMIGLILGISIVIVYFILYKEKLSKRKIDGQDI